MPKLARTEPEIPQQPRRPGGVARVWDPFVRLFHWALALSFLVAFLTRHSSEDVHHWAGYAAGALVALRILWGVVGTSYARFSQFVRRPATVLAYLADMATGREARYLGHNPAGGAMVVALMGAMLAAAITGWMMTTDQFFGVDWVEHLHDLIGNGLLVLVLLHLAGVLLASLRHRENLVRSMLTGLKRAPDSDDIA
jgi:cytochrome b